MATFTDDIFGYSIDYPSNWSTIRTVATEFQSYGSATTSSTGTTNDESGIAVNVDASKSASDTTLEEYYQDYLTAFKQNTNFSSVKELSSGAVNFGQNISGYSATFEFTDSSGKWTIRWFVTSTRNNFYLIAFFSTQSNFKSNTAIFDASINSFKFIDVLPLPVKQTYAAPPAMTIDTNKQYIVTMTTEYGDMIFELYPADAPKTVNNFVFLTREGFYDDTVFHRVIADFVVQGGDPTAKGTGGPGYYIPSEISSRKHLAGTLAMANSGADKNGSQFYICYDALPTLDGKYTVFGQLVQGFEVLYKIELGDRLQKVTVEERESP